MTARELARQVKVDTIDILKIDGLKVKDLSEPLKTKIMPILTGDYMDKIP